MKYPMQFTSPVFQNNDYLPKKYTCDGQNVNPPLLIGNIPKNTKSLALIIDDPDAPSGNWIHWLVWNIQLDTKEILENSVPNGALEGTTSWGKPGYNGPCPPSGTHRYFFKLFALDTLLNLQSSSTVTQLLTVMQNHIIAKAEIVARYSKK
ncbi:MAG: YbhB/YbcL family Raf kinase inhibitor-like protein [Candidatus Shapirobacteria bacterium]